MSMEDDGEEPGVGEGDHMDEEGDTGMNENEEQPTEEADVAEPENDDDDNDGLYPTDDVAEMEGEAEGDGEGDEVEQHDDEGSGKDEASHAPTQVLAATADTTSASDSGNMDVTTDAPPLPPQDEPSSSSSSSSEAVASSIDIPIAPILPILLPSLRGKLMSDGTLNICRGVWAMNDTAHENPDQCRYVSMLMTVSDSRTSYLILERNFPILSYKLSYPLLT